MAPPQIAAFFRPEQLPDLATRAALKLMYTHFFEIDHGSSEELSSTEDKFDPRSYHH